jgi:signal transduction histidine kinase
MRSPKNGQTAADAPTSTPPAVAHATPPSRAPFAAEPTVVAAMWRGLEVFRPVAWLYAVYTAFVRSGGTDGPDAIARPWLAWVVLGVLAAWTVSSVLYRARARTMSFVSIELMLACGAILSTALVDTPSVIASGARTLPGLWPAAAVVAWAVLRGWRGGVMAALLVGVADLLEVGVGTFSTIGGSTISSSTINNIVILVLLGGCIGFCADLSRDGHAALGEALRVQAEVRERDRLARTVHDGVLQILSYIHRRGLELGGEAHELGSMAGDQERILRALVSNVSSTPTTDDSLLSPLGGGQVDLRSLLGQYADAAVSIIPPADPVLMAVKVAEELSAAVSAALDNVRRHAGVDAQAWVLIEDKRTDVTVTIRDNGLGVPAGRLAEAAGNGRMGITNSIEGRMRDLGGSAVLDSRPGSGTSVELTVPRKEPRK